MPVQPGDADPAFPSAVRDCGPYGFSGSLLPGAAAAEARAPELLLEVVKSLTGPLQLVGLCPSLTLASGHEKAGDRRASD